MTVPAALLDAYARRLGFERPIRPDLATLRALHAAHLRTIPFENSSVLFREPIVLDQRTFVEKLAVRRRGGFCYELNGAFATLLEGAGFDVAFLEARTYDHGQLGRRFEHLAMQVNLDEPWLVDVGFGYSFAEPLRLSTSAEQVDPVGSFRLVATDDGVDVEWRHRNGEWVAHYRFDPQPQPLEAFGAECAYLQTSPGSPFVSGWLCSVLDGQGGTTLFGRRLIVSDGDDREERDLSDEALPEVLASRFGVATRLDDGRWVPSDS
ncbi:MAG TPA: arylamine N-acetyltransferase [Candidatus Eisenbacteria bacterium]|nr:arylamine N-acetyltransferase [Candidatus Eisenbacteria bacterium]